MTTPTQAQIEAAAKAIVKRAVSVSGTASPQSLAEAALTAAAQVGEIAPCDDAEFGTYDHVINDRNATIERCAQVADQFRITNGETSIDRVIDAIVAAIRKLKDES